MFLLILEYLEVVHEAFLLEGGEQCISHIRQGINDTLAALRTESGRRMVEQAYRSVFIIIISRKTSTLEQRPPPLSFT